MATKMKQSIAVLDVYSTRGHVRVQERIEARNWQSARKKAEEFAKSREFSLRERAVVTSVEERR